MKFVFCLGISLLVGNLNSATLSDSDTLVALQLYGRRQLFDTGSYLRRRYKHFLPEEFFYSDVHVRCTGMPRIMESSAVVMAAIFPPRDEQRWQDSGLGALYTPIPCEYPPQSEDIDSNGVPLPDWSKTLYPEPLYSIAQLVYVTRFLDPEMIRFGAGEFMREILTTAMTFEEDPPNASTRKVYAYIGHEDTFYAMLIGLGFETYPPIISYGAALIMELHRNQTTREIGFKFLYRNETWSDPIVYTVPGCQEICSLAFVQNYLQPFKPIEPLMNYC